jgi:hypothetical protein
MTDDFAIDVPPGAPLPVAVFVSARQTESNDAYSPGQQELADRVASDFTKSVASDSPSASPDNSNKNAVESAGEERWQKAAALADDRFRALLGDEVYNRELIRQHQIHQ